MNSFGKYLRNKRENLELPLRKVAAELDIDTSILSKIERGERSATKEMIPLLAKSLKTSQTELEIEFIKYYIMDGIGDLKNIKNGLRETIEFLK